MFIKLVRIDEYGNEFDMIIKKSHVSSASRIREESLFLITTFNDFRFTIKGNYDNFAKLFDVEEIKFAEKDNVHTEPNISKCTIQRISNKKYIDSIKEEDVSF